MITDNLSRIFAGKEGYEEDVLKRLKEIDENPYVGCEKEISKLLAKRLVQYMKDNNSDKSIECKNTVYWMAQRLRGKPEFENTRGLLQRLSNIFTDLSLWIK
jgi:hypothetical protein